MEPSSQTPTPLTPDRRQVLAAMALGIPTLALALSGCGTSGAPTPGTVGSPGADPAYGSIGEVRSVVDRPPVAPADLATGGRLLSAFAGRLLGHLASTGGNLVCSPYSVALALAMTRAGARGETATEMDAALGSTSAGQLDAALNALTQQLATRAGRRLTAAREEVPVALEVASTIFGQASVTWERPFLDELAASYGAGLQVVDYERAPEVARLLINRWTSDHTAGLIEDLLPEGSVDIDTRLVLVNALHLKAPWHVAFDEPMSTTAPFHLADGRSVSVPMMVSTEVASGWVHGDGWTGARLPYAGEQLAMTVLLPDAGREDDLVATLAAGLDPVLGAAEPGQVTVSMPRFRATWGTTSLKPALEAMGMRVAFTDGADFSGMTAGPRLLVDDVHHQATITVDEHGTEAAAATAVVMREVSARVSDHELVLDRPFLYVVHDVESRVPLFVGRVSDPR